MENLRSRIKERAEISLECNERERQLFAQYLVKADVESWITVETLIRDVENKTPKLLERYYQVAARDIKARYPLYNKSVKIRIGEEEVYADNLAKFSDSTLGELDKTKEIAPEINTATLFHKNLSAEILLIDLTYYMKYILGMDTTIDGLHYSQPESLAKQKFLISKIKKLPVEKSAHRFFIYKALQEASKEERDKVIDIKYTKMLDIKDEIPKRDGIFWVARQLDWIKEIEDSTLPPIRIVQSREWSEEIDKAMEKIRTHRTIDDLARDFDREAERILCQNLKK